MKSELNTIIDLINSKDDKYWERFHLHVYDYSDLTFNELSYYLESQSKFKYYQGSKKSFFIYK